MVNTILQDLIDKGVVVYIYYRQYLDIYRNKKGHDKIVEENDLFLKPEKCVFSLDEVEFLGLIIGKD